MAKGGCEGKEINRGEERDCLDERMRVKRGDKRIWDGEKEGFIKTERG